MKFRTAFNLDEFPAPAGEKNHGQSMTIPDQSMSIREIMRRYAQGLPVEGERVPIYDEENDLPDPKTLDLTERQEMAENAKNEFNDLSAKYQMEQKELADKKFKKQQEKFNKNLDEKFDKELKAGELKFKESDQGTDDPAA